MVNNISTTGNTTYNSYLYYEKPQSKIKDLPGGTHILTEMNDMDNDVYRNAVTISLLVRTQYGLQI